MPFFKFGCSFVMLYNIQNTRCSFCLFCEYWFEIINYNMHYIHMCYKCLACKSKMASILNLIVGSSVGCPLNCPLFPYLKAHELPTISVYRSSGQPYLHGKIPMGSPLRCPLSCPLFHIWKQWTALLSCPLFPYMEVVGSLICMAKFPLAAHSAAHWAAHFFIFGTIGLPTELPTELPIVSIYGSSGQPNLHGTLRAAHPVAHVQSMGSYVGSSPVFSVWA